MARVNIVLPAMGEGVIEATINKWLIKAGDTVREDDPLVEVATDKVDSEVPAPVSGVVTEITVKEESVAKVGQTIAIMETEKVVSEEDKGEIEKEIRRIKLTVNDIRHEKKEEYRFSHVMKSRTPSGKFLSPLVRRIAAGEGISYSDLDKINGTGMDGRITKDDILAFLEKTQKEKDVSKTDISSGSTRLNEAKLKTDAREKQSMQDEVIEMDRVRKLIAEHMVMSKRTSPHVTSFIDADVTRMMIWRNSIKEKFLTVHGQKLTLTPVFIDAAAKALQEFPMVNISVDGDKIIIKKNINIGMATALPNGNLIVPVIRNANEKNLTGLAKAVNDLAERARNNKLKPDEIAGGTFTVTNFGSYNNLSGTPIINQPQAAILGTGAVRKMPAVLETADGDVIAIRYIMILSLSYDHRVIDGALAGKFLNRLKELLEDYSPDLIL